MRSLVILTFTILLVLLRLLPAPGTAQAHITAEMPDPIAEVEYQMMLDFEPNDLITRYKLAMVYYRLKKDSEAQKELETVLAKDANHFYALEGMGMLLVRQKRFAKAKGFLKRAAARPKRESGTLYYLAMAHQGLGEIKEAAKILQEGRKLAESEPKKKRAVPIKDFDKAIAALNHHK